MGFQFGCILDISSEWRFIQTNQLRFVLLDLPVNMHRCHRDLRGFCFNQVSHVGWKIVRKPKSFASIVSLCTVKRQFFVHYRTQVDLLKKAFVHAFKDCRPLV